MGPVPEGEMPDATSADGNGGDPSPEKQLFVPPDQWAFSNDLGQQIRSLRQARGLTLEAVAQRSGTSIGALSQVERGKGNPAFFTLVKVAHALEVPVTSLLQPATRTSPVVRADQRRPLAPHFFEQDVVVSALLTPDLDRQMQVARYTLPPGASTESTPFTHHGEEFLTVLKGTVTVGLDQVEHVLRAGDSISYPAATSHWFSNSGKGVAELLFACTPPTF
jgi:transcriptional regulator with XRE-family HTH domain